MKRNFIIMMLLSALLILTACGVGDGNNEGPTADSEKDPVIENNDEIEDDVEVDTEDEIEEEDQAENDSGNNEADAEDESEDTKENVFTATGIYNGQADPHTIEIETDDGPTAFQITLEARDDVELLTEGENVTYTYHEEDGQHIIESIIKSE